MKIPATVKTAINTSVGVMLGSLALPQERISGALRALFAELEGEGGINTITNHEPLDRALKRETVAGALGVSKYTVSKMCKRGALLAVYGGADGQRATGISEASVRAFLAGRSAT